MDNEHIIRIILRARDETAATLAKARAELSAFQKNANQLQLFDTGDAKRATKDVKEFTQAVKQSTDAQKEHQRSLSGSQLMAKRVAEALNPLKKAHADLDRQIKAGNTDRDYLVKQFKRLGDEFEKASKKFDIGSPQARSFFNFRREARAAAGDIDNYITRLRAAGDEADHHGSILSRLNSRLRQNRVELERNKASLQGLSSWWREANQESRRADTRFRELAITFAVANFQGFVTVVEALGGALAALAGSAEQAGIALAGAMTSAAAQAVPAIGLMLLSVQRLTAIFGVLKQVQAEQQAQSVQNVQHQNKEANSANSLANAHKSVVDAQRQVIDAQRGLIAARREAARQLQDLILAEKEAQLAAQGATLSQEEAQSALRQSIASGDISNIAQRQLSVRQAGLGVTSAQQGLSRARQDLGLTRQGAPGFDQLRQAQEQVRQANESLQQARRGVENAARTANFAADQGITAARKLQFLESQLSGSEIRLFRTLQKIVNIYQDKNGPIRKITDIITDAFTVGAQNTLKLLHDPAFLGQFTRLAQSIAGAIRGATRTFFSPEVQGQFAILTSEATRNIPRIAGTIDNLFKSFLNIAVAARKILRDIIDLTLKWSDNFRKTTSNTRNMEQFFRDVEGHLIAWGKLLLSFGRLLQAILTQGAPQGENIVTSLTKAFDSWTKWINENPAKVQKFFRDSVTVLSQLGGIVKILASALADLFNPGNSEVFLQFIEAIAPAFKLAAIFAGDFVRILVGLIHLTGPFGQFIISLVIMNRLLFTLPKYLAQVVVEFTIWIARMIVGDAALAAFNARLILFAKQIIPALIFGVRALGVAMSLTLVGAIIAIIAALVILQEKFHIFNKLWDLIKEGIRDVVNFIKKHWVDVLIVLLTGPFGPIIVLVRHNMGRIKAVFSDVFDAIKDVVRSAWRGIAAIFRGAFGGIAKFVGRVGDTIVGIFSDIGGGIADAFQTGLGIAYSIIATFINGAVSAFNAVGGALNKILPGNPIKHTDFHLPSTLSELRQQNLNKRRLKANNIAAADAGGIAQFGGNIIGAASGAMVSAQPGGRIFQVGEGGYDEVILSTDPRYKRRTASLLDEFLQKTGAKYAEGGWVNKLPSQVSLAGVHMGVLQAARNIIQHYPGLIITSGTGGGHAANSYHYRGEAVDIGGPAAVMNAAARWIARTLGGSLAEGIHNPGLSVKDGKSVPASFWGSTTWGNHINHIHVAVAGALRALGGATGDVTKLIKNKLKPVDASKVGMFGPVINYVRARLRKSVQDAADKAGGGDSLASLAGIRQLGAGRAAIRNMAHRMVAAFFGEGQWPAFDALEMQEAGYNPFARNPSSGAFGIPQALPPTKMPAAAQRGDAKAQLEWMLQYIRDRYGNPAKAWGGYWARGGWYARGGELPGPFGMMLPIMAHAGEWILNRGQQSRLANWMGTSRDRLKGMLGFTGGPTSFQGGGAPTATGGQRQITDANRLERLLAQDLAQTTEGSITQIAALIRLFRRLDSHGKSFAANLRKSLTALDTEFDQLNTNIENHQTEVGTRIQRLSYIIKRSGVILKRSAPQIAGLELLALEGLRSDLQETRSLLLRQRRNITRRIAELRRGGITGDEKNELQQLQTAQGNVRGRIRDINQRIAQNIADIYEKQQEVFQANLDNALNPNDIATKANEVGQRIAQALGNTGLSRQLQLDNIHLLEQRRNTLNTFWALAMQRGDAAMAQQIFDQVADLNASIVEATTNLLQSAVDDVNAEVQKQQAAVSRSDRLAALLGAAGDPVAAARATAANLGTTGGILQNQLGQLQYLQQLAAQQGNIGVFNSLGEQIEELKVAIAENTQAQKDAPVQIRQAIIDQLLSGSQFRTGIFGNLQNIVNTIGTISGAGPDTKLLSQLVSQTISTLQTTGAGLTQQLLSGFGVNLTGLSGNELVRAIANLDTQGIESHMDTAQRQQFEALINSIIENESALQQNTQQLQELNNALTGPQTFSSTAWQLFRQAVFNGMGGLLPQFQIPQLATGGIIERSGLAYLHQGETVTPAQVNKTNVGGDVHINIDHPIEVADPVYIGQRVMWELSHTR